MSHIGSSPNQFSASSANTAGSFSETDDVSFQGTLAQGRADQSPHKNWLLLAFAKRVIDGDAKPHETAFMTALMAADIPAEAQGDCMSGVVNTIAFINCINEMDSETLIEAAIHAKGGE